MKKINTIFVVACALLWLIACTESQSDPASKNQTSSTVQESSTLSANSDTPEPTADPQLLETLRTLVDENYVCITSMYEFGRLPHGETGTDLTAHVLSEEFRSVTDIEDYLKTVYCEAEVNRLMEGDPEEGPLYFEKDGVLVMRDDMPYGGGLFAPWTDYEITVKEQDESTCRFEITVNYEDYGSNEKERYSFTAVYEDTWKLEKMVSSSVIDP